MEGWDELLAGVGKGEDELQDGWSLGGDEKIEELFDGIVCPRVKEGNAGGRRRKRRRGGGENRTLGDQEFEDCWKLWRFSDLLQRRSEEI